MGTSFGSESCQIWYANGVLWNPHRSRSCFAVTHMQLQIIGWEQSLTTISGLVGNIHSYYQHYFILHYFFRPQTKIQSLSHPCCFACCFTGQKTVPVFRAVMLETLTTRSYGTTLESGCTPGIWLAIYQYILLLDREKQSLFLTMYAQSAGSGGLSGYLPYCFGRYSVMSISLLLLLRRTLHFHNRNRW